MKLSPENEFVISVLRYFLRRESSFPCDENLLNSMDWNKIIQFVKYQNVISIIYHVLSKQELLNKIPPKSANEIEKDYLEKTAFILRYENILKEITDTLYQKGIPFIVIKGPAIAFDLYDPCDVRPYNDLDLLIRGQDYNQVKVILSKHKFKVTNPSTEARRRKYLNSIEFYETGGIDIAIDLHWDTLMVSWGRAYFSKQKVWEDIRWMKLPGMSIPTLDPMLLIPYLCVHLALHHQFGKLQTLCDLDLAIRKFSTDIDWNEMLEWSARMKIKKAVIYSIKLAAVILHTEAPAALSTVLERETIVEKWFPFSYFIFRENPVSEMKSRIARFFLIDDVPGKAQSVATFLKLLSAAIIAKVTTR